MLDFSSFEIITFDCYGTLVDWEEGILRTLRTILSSHNKKIDDADILKLYGDFEQQLEEGDFRPYREVLGLVVRKFGEEFGFTATAEDEISLPHSLSTWKPWPDTVAALQNLKSHFRLAILSNVDDDLFAATKPQLRVEFDEIITARQARAYKPSPKIFQMALSRVGVPAYRILHVGQSIFHDVIPAQSLGLATVWVNRPSARPNVGAVRAAAGKPELTVTSLEELAAVATRM
jgi:2-haloacid dehalogenase